MSDRKAIFISKDTHARIVKRGKFGDSYNDIIKRILDKIDTKDNK